jgi:hypothetical protein
VTCAFSRRQRQRHDRRSKDAEEENRAAQQREIRRRAGRKCGHRAETRPRDREREEEKLQERATFPLDGHASDTAARG